MCTGEWLPELRRAHAEGDFSMKTRALATVLAAAGVLAAMPMCAQDGGQGSAIVTVTAKKNGEIAPNITQQDIQSIKVDGKPVKITNFQSLRSQRNQVELVILIDEAARSSLGEQIGDIRQFVNSLPPNVKASIAYMENGRSVFSGPFSTDHAKVLSALHLPAGVSGVDASPYFCLSDLAKNWPSQDRTARREVVAITDGIDYYYRRYDPDDPYVQAAMTDTVRAGIIVYSIYWKNVGRADNTLYGNDTGQNLMDEVTQATGGRSFWQGLGNPVSFQPYLEELNRCLNNQYEIGFAAPLKEKPQVERFNLKLTAPGAEVDAPQQVYVYPGATAER
jgi:hypothetical protein